MPYASAGLHTGADLAAQLRAHAGEVLDHSPQATSVVHELMQMADLLDGGTGLLVHHGCPDPSIPTADCVECHLVVQAEADAYPSWFRGTDLAPAEPS